MIDTVKRIIDLIIQFINSLAQFKIELQPGTNVSVLYLAIGFVAIVLIIYFIMRGFGFMKGSDD